MTIKPEMTLQSFLLVGYHCNIHTIYLLTAKQSCRIYKNNSHSIWRVRTAVLPLYQTCSTLFSLRAQNQTYTTLSAKHVYCIHRLFFCGAVLPVGLTKSICLLL